VLRNVVILADSNDEMFPRHHRRRCCFL